MKSASDRWQHTLVAKTEQFLSWRKRRHNEKKEAQKKKNPILDWVEAFIWAAFVVLLINQYVLQAYQIPSGSMISTLLEGDRIFVNKLIYGPELIPGMLKMPGFTEPSRSSVIIFENPSYISKGPIFDIVQRVLYMVTLSLVDIDRDQYGRPRAHFLIKRAVGVAHDRLRLREGNMYFRPEGENRWYSEEEFKKLSGLEYHQRRLVQQEQYPMFKDAAEATVYRELSIPLTDKQKQAIDAVTQLQYVDGYYLDMARNETFFAANPQNERYASREQFYENGWYVPSGRIFPMGDNRDNSRDARSFGAVSEQKVLGRAMFIYWPLQRLGAIR